MSDFQISDGILEAECRELAQEIIDDIKRDLAEDETLEDKRDDMSDRAHETADGHEWVIYNHKALMLCAHCDTEMGEDLLSDCGIPEDPDIYKLACMIAYGEMRGRIDRAINEILEEETESEDA